MTPSTEIIRSRAPRRCRDGGEQHSESTVQSVRARRDREPGRSLRSRPSRVWQCRSRIEGGPRAQHGLRSLRPSPARGGRSPAPDRPPTNHFHQHATSNRAHLTRGPRRPPLRCHTLVAPCRLMNDGRGEKGSSRSVSGVTPGCTSQLVPASDAGAHASRATRRRCTTALVTTPVVHHRQSSRTQATTQ